MALRTKPRITITEKPAPDAPEWQRALWWRQHVMIWTRERLSSAIGYEPDSIRTYESRGGPKKESTWQRYRNACGAVDLAERKHAPLIFNWGL